MKELKTLSFFFSANIFQRQPVVLRKELWHILHAQRIILLFVRHHWLHGNLLKSLIGEMDHILGKIRVIVRICASHIIIHLVPALGCLLIFRKDLVIAALPAPVGTHQVMDLFSAVYAEYQICHLLIRKLHDFIIEQHAVGGQRKAEFLMVRLLQRPAVSDQVFYHLPVHKRLPAEEIHLQIHPAAGVRHEEIQRFLSHFQTHQRPSAVVFALPRKAVFTCQIAVVGNVQAERLHYRLPVFEGIYVVLVDILRKKLSLRFQIQDLPHRLLRLGRLHGQFLRHRAGDFILRFYSLP